MPGARRRWRQPKWPGPGPNRRGQLVACGQGEAGLMIAHARPARAKLGLASVRVLRGLRVNSISAWCQPQMVRAQMARTWAKSKMPTCQMPTR